MVQKTTIDVPFIGGLNQGTNSKALTAPDLITLNNGRYREDRSIDKCLGFSRLGSASTSLIGLATWRDELLRMTSGTLASWSDAGSTWSDRGVIYTGRSKMTQVAGSPSSALSIDTIEQDGVRVVTWGEGTSTYYSVIDVVTGSTLRNRNLLMGTVVTTSRPRLVSIPNNIYIIYNASAGHLSYTRIPCSSPSLSAGGTIYTTLASTAFDACSVGEQVFVAFESSASSDLQISRLNSEMVVTATTTISTGVALTYLTCGSLDDSIGVSWYDQIMRFSTDLSVISTVSSVTAPSSTVRTFAQGGMFMQSGTSIYRADVASGAEAVFYQSAYLHSQVVDGFMVLYHSATLQPTYFVLGPTGQIISKIAAGQAGGVGTRLSNFTASSTPNTYVFGALKKGRIQSENAVLFASTLPYIAEVSLDPSVAGQTVQAGEDLLIAGGVLKAYDGKSVTDYGFLLYPESITPTASNGAGSIPVGSYLVAALYEWTDGQGVRHQSAPSPLTAVSVSGMSDTITVVVPSLTFINYSGIVRESVQIKVFITTDAGTVPYYAGVTNNNTSATSVSIVLLVDPASLTANEILYTTGGALENLAAPSHSYAFSHDNRIVLCGLEDRNQVAFSKDIKPLTGVGFHEDFVITLGPTGGDCIAGASLENVMVLFKETAIFAISGTGPNDLGENSTFSAPQLISNSVGCRDLKSVCSTPQGIYFMSRKGLYFLSRSLELAYIGRPVEDYNSSTILASNLYPDADEIRFLTDANKTLIYHYGFKRWSTQDSYDAQDATVWNDTYVYATSTKVLLEDSATYLNDGSYVPMTIRTGWIHLGAMMGYQRAYRLGLLGTYYTNNTFRIKVYQNYSDIVREDTGVTASSLVNTSVYGDSATYGADTYYGGSAEDEVYQLRHSFANQKCSAISIEISDGTAGTGTTGQGYSLQGLSLVLGGKGGIFRHSTTRTV